MLGAEWLLHRATFADHFEDCRACHSLPCSFAVTLRLQALRPEPDAASERAETAVEESDILGEEASPATSEVTQLNSLACEVVLPGSQTLCRALAASFRH